jgi:hypothetical protein
MRVPIPTALSLAAAVTLLAASAHGESYEYADIAKRYSDVKLTDPQLRHARMQGECLVGLKNLNFKRSAEFDAVAEWTNYRSLSLLEQFPPCTVLVMMEVARELLMAEQ